jgi:hypothetical protein
VLENQCFWPFFVDFFEFLKKKSFVQILVEQRKIKKFEFYSKDPAIFQKKSQKSEKNSGFFKYFFVILDN